MNTAASLTDPAYGALKLQFKAINRVLRDTHDKLSDKEGELDVLTYYLNSILNHMSQGLLFVSLEGFVTTCNTAAEAMLEIDGANVLFQPFADHFQDAIFGFSLKQALETKKAPKKIFVSIETKQGIKELEIDTTFVIKKNLSATLSHHLTVDILQGIIILIRDITGVRKLQNLVNRNDRMKALGEMAALVAHEIRNPLGGIKGFASLLERDLQDQPQLKQLASYIVEGTDNLNRLVTNVLKYARPFQATMELTDVVTISQEVIQHVQADASVDPRIAIVLQTSAASLLVPLDAQLFKSALLNLIVNAIQAMSEGGQITIVLEEVKDWAIIKVTDTGHGITPENLKKLFSPFFTTKTTGNGFGLAEVDQVVRAHGGTIEVSSVVDQGAEFLIKLPLKPFGVE